MIGRGAQVAIACGLLATASGAVATYVDAPRETDWRKAATAADRARLRRWRAAWIEALTNGRSKGAGAAVAADAALSDPDRALSDARLPFGGYACRIYRLGIVAMNASRTASEWTRCTVTRQGEATAFQIEGAQRIDGYIYDAGNTRGVFLGAIGFGDEHRVMRYGRDATRDMAGFVERIGAKRWRLVLPYPHFGGTLDLVEIVPRD